MTINLGFDASFSTVFPLTLAVGQDIPPDEAWPPRDRTYRNQLYGLPIKGPEYFVRDATAIIREIERLPQRQAELIRCLPRILHVPNLTLNGNPVLALADGTFAYTGDDFAMFRYTILHETGHNLSFLTNSDNSEYSAINYANTVLAEMGYPPQWNLSHTDFTQYIDHLHNQIAIYKSTHQTVTSSAINPNNQNKRQTPNTLIGYDTSDNSRLPFSSPICLSDDARSMHTYVIGLTGMGKSTLLLNMIRQDIAKGHSVIVMEPHAQLVSGILKTTKMTPDRVVLLQPTNWKRPFGLNIFQTPPNASPLVTSQVAEAAVDIIKKSWLLEKGASWGPIMDVLMPQIAYTFAQVPGSKFTLVDVPNFLEDTDFRNHVLININNPDLQDFWERSYSEREAASILRRIRRFTIRPAIRTIMGQSKSTVDFADIINNGKVLLVPLPEIKIGSDSASMIGQLIVNGVLNAALSRTDIPENKRAPFSFYIDEFQNFATPDLEKMFTELRKFGARIVVSHQRRGQLERGIEDAVTSAVNKVVFQVNSADARALSGEFSQPIKQSALPLVPHPLKALVAKTHVDPIIRDLLEIQLAFIESLINSHMWKIYNIRYGRKKCDQMSKDNFEIINGEIDRYLSDMMTGAIDIGSKQETRHLVGIYLSSNHITLCDAFGMNEPPKPDVRYYDTSFSWQATQSLTTESLIANGHYYDRVFAENEKKNEEGQRRLDAYYQKLNSYKVGRIHTAISCVEGMLRSPTLQGDWSPMERFQAGHGLGWDAQLRLPKLLSQLAHTARVLQRSPIRVRDAYGAEEVSDPRNLANLLVGLDTYHARVKLMIGKRVTETTIVTNPEPDPLPIETATHQLAQIVDHAYATYLVPIEQVEAQITERQRAHRQRSKPEPIEAPRVRRVRGRAV